MALSRSLAGALAAALAASPLALVGCGPTVHETHGAGLALGADVRIEVSHLAAGTHDLRITATYLPPPGRLRPGATGYALWLIPAGGEPRLGGIFDYDPETREAELRATVPASELEVRITAELERTPEAPSDHVALRHRVED